MATLCSLTRNGLDWISDHGSVSGLVLGYSETLVQRVRGVTLIGTNGALDGDIVEEDLVARHGGGEISIPQ